MKATRKILSTIAFVIKIACATCLSLFGAIMALPSIMISAVGGLISTFGVFMFIEYIIAMLPYNAIYFISSPNRFWEAINPAVSAFLSGNTISLGVIIPLLVCGALFFGGLFLVGASISSFARVFRKPSNER